MRLLALIVFGNFVSVPLAVAAEWSASRFSPLALAVPALGVVYGVWLLREASRVDLDMLRRADLVFVVLATGAGLMIEAVVYGPPVTASMNNPGFSALAASTYVAAVRLSRWASIPVVFAAALGHAVASRSTPTEAMQGAMELVVIWAATRLVVRQVRRAGCEADAARDAARRAEREEASARVHDALGLLRVVARGDGAGEDLRRAVEETARRTHSWLAASSEVPHLASTVDAVVGQFPDLAIRQDVGVLPIVSDPAVVTAVGRAVHTLLGNVREHAGATLVEIVGGASRGGWALTIRDDGRGFDVAATTRRGGLTRFTREALAAVGVSMSLQSEPGTGTAVTLWKSLSKERTESMLAGRRGSPARRFASWRVRPRGGNARASWLADVIQAGLATSYAVMVTAGYGYLLRHSERPAIAGVLVLAGAFSLALTWLLGPRPPKALAVTCTALAVAAGAVVTYLNGPAAATGDKLGIMLMAWSCMLLAAARPDCRVVSVILSLVPLAIFARFDALSGVVTALWIVLGSLIAGRLVESMTTLGAEAEADRRNAAAQERNSAARVLLRQASAMGDAATGSTSEQRTTRLAFAAREAEDYLRPPTECMLGILLRATVAERALGDQLEVVIDDLDADLGPATARRVAYAVAEIAASLAALCPHGKIRVRGVGTSVQWRVTILAETRPDIADRLRTLITRRLRADLASIAVAISARSLPGGDLLVDFRPTHGNAQGQPA